MTKVAFTIDEKVGRVILAVVACIGGGLTALVFMAADTNDTPSDITRALPSDLCVIDGKPLMPELDYIDHGSRSAVGLVLKYVNANGDLVMVASEQIIGIYEGDFCHD